MKNFILIIIFIICIFWFFNFCELQKHNVYHDVPLNIPPTYLYDTNPSVTNMIDTFNTIETQGTNYKINIKDGGYTYFRYLGIPFINHIQSFGYWENRVVFGHTTHDLWHYSFNMSERMNAFRTSSKCYRNKTWIHPAGGQIIGEYFVYGSSDTIGYFSFTNGAVLITNMRADDTKPIKILISRPGYESNAAVGIVDVPADWIFQQQSEFPDVLGLSSQKKYIVAIVNFREKYLDLYRSIPTNDALYNLESEDFTKFGKFYFSGSGKHKYHNIALFRDNDNNIWFIGFDGNQNDTNVNLIKLSSQDTEASCIINFYTSANPSNIRTFLAENTSINRKISGKYGAGAIFDGDGRMNLFITERVISKRKKTFGDVLYNHWR